MDADCPAGDQDARRHERPHRGSTIATTIIAAVVAVALVVVGIIALALINPYALIGLPPVLFAVAAIVRALTGTP